MLKNRNLHIWAVTNIPKILYKLYKFKTFKVFLPRVALVEISEACNLNCVMCTRNNLDFESNVFMNLNNFMTLIMKMPKLRYIQFMGIGEPFLNREILHMVDFGRTKKINFGLITNGVLLHEEISKNISQRPNIFNITFSIDSANKEIYYKIRGADLDKVKNNIKFLRKISNFSIGINCVLLEENVISIYDWINFCNETKVKQITFLQSMFTSNHNLFGKNIFKKNVFKDLLKFKKDAAKYGINVKIPAENPTLLYCYYPFFIPQIKLSGDILACCYMNIFSSSDVQDYRNEFILEEKYKIPFKNYILGNIYSNSIEELWNSERIRMLRRFLVDSNNMKKTMNFTNYIKLRNELEPSVQQEFNYCKVCPWRWSIAC